MRELSIEQTPHFSISYISRCFSGRGLAVSRALNRVWDTHGWGLVVATILRRSGNWVHFCLSYVSIFILVVCRVWKHSLISVWPIFLNFNWIVLARGLLWYSFSWDRNDYIINDLVFRALRILNSRDGQSVVFRMSSIDSLIFLFDSTSINILDSDSDSSVSKVFSRLSCAHVSEWLS